MCPSGRVDMDTCVPPAARGLTECECCCRKHAFPFTVLLAMLSMIFGPEGKGIKIKDTVFFRKWPFSGEDDRGKTSPRALVFTRCDIQSERL
jgi:hypothetical protein